MFKININKRCCQNRYKLVLMDLNMPIMDGYDATKKIIKIIGENNIINSDSNYDCKVVAITAFVNDENKKKCYRSGMVEVLHKPVAYDRLKLVFDKYYQN